MVSQKCIYGVNLVILILLTTVSADTIPEHQSPQTGGGSIPASPTSSPPPTVTKDSKAVTNANENDNSGDNISNQNATISKSGGTTLPGVKINGSTSTDKPTTQNDKFESSSRKIDTTKPPKNVGEGEPVFLSRLSSDEAREKSRVTLQELDVNSHAGFITVDESLGHHLFFWMVAKQEVSVDMLFGLS